MCVSHGVWPLCSNKPEHRSLWQILFAELQVSSWDGRPEVRNCGIRTLFSTVSRHGPTFSEDLWTECLLAVSMFFLRSLSRAIERESCPLTFSSVSACHRFFCLWSSKLSNLQRVLLMKKIQRLQIDSKCVLRGCSDFLVNYLSLTLCDPFNLYVEERMG